MNESGIFGNCYSYLSGTNLPDKAVYGPASALFVCIDLEKVFMENVKIT